MERALRAIPFPALSDIALKRPSEGENIDALDGVRGLAVLIVVVGHCWALGLRGQAPIGVWLFFCLSGFLLTMPFVRRPQQVGDPRYLARYWTRRVLRILPAYYSVLVFVFFVFDKPLGYLLQHMLFVRAQGIFWTMPQEMLFYVVLPFLAALHLYVCRRNIPATVGALLLISLLAQEFLLPPYFHLNGNNAELPFFLGIFATGMAFSYLYHEPRLARLVVRPGINRALHVLGIAILLLLVGTSQDVRSLYLSRIPLLGEIFAAGPHRWSDHYKATYGLLCGGLIYITLVCRGRLLDRLMRSTILRAFGLVSFSLYLVHLLVANYFIAHGVPRGNRLVLVTLPVAYAIACVMYTLIERPFMRMGSRLLATTRSPKG